MFPNPEWIAEIDDAEAWQNNAEHRWVYDRLLVATTQDYRCGPCGIAPPEYPVVVKPITNMFGMSMGATLECAEFGDRPGYMWSDLLSGRHVSTDMIVWNGECMWSAHAIGYRGSSFGRFSAWELLDTTLSELETIKLWCSIYLASYSGPINVETIGGKIIEVHLRLSPDWQRAGMYLSYTSPPARAIGIPFFDHPLPERSFAGASIDREKVADRHAFVAVRL